MKQRMTMAELNAYVMGKVKEGYTLDEISLEADAYNEELGLSQKCVKDIILCCEAYKKLIPYSAIENN